MDTFFSDLTYAARGLRKNFGFSLVATITIALGIGACTAIFSVVNAVLLRPLPYADAQRLVAIWGELRTRHVDDWPFSPPDLRDLQQQSTGVFEAIAGIIPAGRVPLGAPGGDPEQIRVGGATTNLFRVLGARIIAGRDFIDDDGTPVPQVPNQAAVPGPPVAALLSHAFWLRRFGGDPADRQDVELGNGRARIVGVLAPGFELLLPPRVNVESTGDGTAARINVDTANRNNVVFRVIGKLKPGVSAGQAQLQADRIAADLRAHFAIKQTAGLYFHVIPLFDDLVGDVRPTILSLMGAVAFVLLIACANVANLLVVRAAGRRRELAVRAAIGAGRAELVRQMLAESLVIAAFGTALGLALARAGIQLLLALGPNDLPRLGAVAMDPAVLAFAVAAGFATALVCGIIPALRASRTDVMEVLRSVGGRAGGLSGGRRLRSGVVVTEVALSFVLLIGAGLMLRSVLALQEINPGYDPNGVLTFVLNSRARQAEERMVFNQQVREKLMAIPGVTAASAATPLPLDGTLINGRWGTETAVTDPSKFRQANFHGVLPGYFEALHTRLIAGRVFTDADNNIDQKTDLPRQVIIDETLAALAFRGKPAVGQRLLLRITTPEAEWYEVIGVVGHQRHSSLATAGPEAIFVPNGHFGTASRTMGGPDRRRSESDHHGGAGRGRAGRSARAARRDSADDGLRGQGDGADPFYRDPDRHLRRGRGHSRRGRSLRRAVDHRAPADRGNRHADGVRGAAREHPQSGDRRRAQAERRWHRDRPGRRLRDHSRNGEHPGRRESHRPDHVRGDRPRVRDRGGHGVVPARAKGLASRSDDGHSRGVSRGGRR